MKRIEYEVQEKLFSLQDVKYKDFHSKLIPSVDPVKVIGVRTPVLRKYAKEFGKLSEAQDFLACLPHEYYEENNLHAFLLEQIRDFDGCIRALDEFLPYVDNWATCDSMSPKVLGKHLTKLLPIIMRWLTSGHIYMIRYAIGCLMRYYLDDTFETAYLQLVASVKSEEYYIKMMQAWYFATALAKQYEATVVYLEGRRLDIWVHNKTIQKAVESYRISDEQKQYLRTLRIKK